MFLKLEVKVTRTSFRLKKAPLERERLLINYRKLIT